jgi:hypothetical protein
MKPDKLNPAWKATFHGVPGKDEPDYEQQKQRQTDSKRKRASAP